MFPVKMKRIAATETEAAEIVTASGDEKAVAVARENGNGYVVTYKKIFSTKEDRDSFVLAESKRISTRKENISKMKSDLAKAAKLVRERGKTDLADKTEKALATLNSLS